MNIENKDLSYPSSRVPIAILETIKVGERIGRDSFDTEMSMDSSKILFVPNNRILEIQNNDFLENNLVGRMAVERGIDLRLLYTPSSTGTVVKDEEGLNTIYFSSDVLKSISGLNEADIKQRKFISNGSTYIFTMIADLLLENASKEVPFKHTPDFVMHVAASVPDFLKISNQTQNDPKVEEFAREFQEFMEANSDKTSFTAKGSKIMAFVGDEKAFDILLGHDQAVRSIIIKSMVERFKKEMTKKYIWFSSDTSIDFTVPEDSETMKLAINFLRGIGDIKTVGDLLDAYKSSDIGLRIGEEVVRVLMIEKHTGSDKGSVSDSMVDLHDIANEWDEDEGKRSDRRHGARRDKRELYDPED